jgi:hypothetical protein
MKVLLGRRGDTDLHVILCHQLDPMSRPWNDIGIPSTPKALRKKHDHGTPLAPFGLTTLYQLMDDVFPLINEITTVGLPNQQTVGESQTIRILETERGDLVRLRIQDIRRGLIRRQVL